MVFINVFSLFTVVLAYIISYCIYKKQWNHIAEFNLLLIACIGLIRLVFMFKNMGNAEQTGITVAYIILILLYAVIILIGTKLIIRFRNK